MTFVKPSYQIVKHRRVEILLYSISNYQKDRIPVHFFFFCRQQWTTFLLYSYDVKIQADCNFSHFYYNKVIFITGFCKG